MTKKKIGLLGGMGSRASALIYQRAMDYVHAYDDSSFPDLMIYNCPFVGSTATAKKSLVIERQVQSGLDRLQQAGCTEIWLGCNSMHLYDVSRYPVVDMPKMFIAEHKVFFDYQPIVLGSEATNQNGLYPGKQGSILTSFIDAVIKRPPTQKDIYEFEKMLIILSSSTKAVNFCTRDNLQQQVPILIACTELSVLFWSIPNAEIKFPKVLDTLDFIAYKISQS